MQFMRSADDAQCRGQFKILYRCRDWRGDWHLHVKAASYPPSEVGINVDEVRKHLPANLPDRNFRRQFKHKRRGKPGCVRMSWGPWNHIVVCRVIARLSCEKGDEPCRSEPSYSLF